MSPWATDPVFGDEYWVEAPAQGYGLWDEPDETEETLELALKSVLRWVERVDLPAEARLHAIRLVIEAALS